MDNRERVGRSRLAPAFRLAVRLGSHKGVCSHFSLALSEDGREFLVNPYGRHIAPGWPAPTGRKSGSLRSATRRTTRSEATPSWCMDASA